MNNVNCNQCKSLLFLTSKSDLVQIGIEAMEKGFVYKNAILFLGVDSKLFFCNKECKNAYYLANIPENKEISNAINELRKDIPSISKDICSKMDTLVKSLKKR